jgi:hypothetical protein
MLQKIKLQVLYMIGGCKLRKCLIIPLAFVVSQLGARKFSKSTLCPPCFFAILSYIIFLLAPTIQEFGRVLSLVVSNCFVLSC